jgi:hypothetical protein
VPVPVPEPLPPPEPVPVPEVAEFEDEGYGTTQPDARVKNINIDRAIEV